MKPKLKTKCLYCKVDFEVIPSRLTRKDANTAFCSRNCVNTYQPSTPLALNGNFRGDRKAIKGGKREDLGGLYVRSSWEANYARYLNWLAERKQIKEWKFEPITFEFVKIKKGNRYYTPDFQVFYFDGSYEFHEVKGYMDAQSKTKLKRMVKYHPKEKIVLIDKPVYMQIHRQMKNLIPFWENLS